MIPPTLGTHSNGEKKAEALLTVDKYPRNPTKLQEE